MRRIFLLLSVLLLTRTLVAQSFDFYKEEISFGIDTVFFSVSGDYYFRNNTGRTLSPEITYPVRRCTPGKPFDTVMAYDISGSGLPLKMTISDTLGRFMINLPPYAYKMIRVFYRQRHNGTAARYILLTTKNWNKPLEDARYSLVIRKNIVIDQFSIAPDRSVDFGDTTVYYWKRKNFMPERDFEVKFRITGNK
jgi:hypothetical protein